ncbi:MAG: tRNA (cytosine(32)/uridine(32)-2'-O)-methyltransferase TrmJ [Halobacteria archaeon]|nr:tRNA (cytosine(32)/uridine(32)-2'-O)-methyltransferase TrmJ [Halobacteria archaeon]
MLSNIRVILLNTSHPGNIGAAARAMKTMGLEDLRLVNPKQFPHAEATARASGADDLLARAGVYTRLEEALQGCRLVIGASARARSIPCPILDPRECARQVRTESEHGPVAVLFGCERSGLSNAEMDRCHALVRIPASDAYSSLNLAAAVQVICYELFAAHVTSEAPEGDADADHGPVGADEMERFYEHLERTMVELGFLDPANPRQLMRRLRRLFNRARPDENEMNILRGILTAAQATRK